MFQAMTVINVRPALHDLPQTSTYRVRRTYTIGISQPNGRTCLSLYMSHLVEPMWNTSLTKRFSNIELTATRNIFNERKLITTSAIQILRLSPTVKRSTSEQTMPDGRVIFSTHQPTSEQLPSAKGVHVPYGVRWVHGYWSRYRIDLGCWREEGNQASILS
jgi:hypothetical protein